jgi:hypothetical protein
MESALVGVVGALFGLAVGSGFTFWSTRRSELAAAVAAASSVAEQLRISAGDRPVVDDGADVMQAWTQHRAALILHLVPDDYRKLGARVRRAAQDQAVAEDLASRLEAVSDVLWGEHNEFILKPLLRWASGDMSTKRTGAALSL